MFRTVSWTRLTAAGACLAVLPFAHWVPGLAVLLALVVVTVALNVAEAVIVRRQQRIENVWHQHPHPVPEQDGLALSE